MKTKARTASRPEKSLSIERDRHDGSLRIALAGDYRKADDFIEAGIASLMRFKKAQTDTVVIDLSGYLYPSKPNKEWFRSVYVPTFVQFGLSRLVVVLPTDATCRASVRDTLARLRKEGLPLSIETAEALALANA